MNKEKEKPDHSAIERQLAPRLRWMGYLLFVFSFIAMVYSFFLPKAPDDGFDTVEEQEVSAGLSLPVEEIDPDLPENHHAYYLFSTIFAGVGFLCIALANRKKAKL